MKNVAFVLIFIIGVLIMVGCSKNNNVSKSKLDEIIEKNNYIIVDVRTYSEYSESHIKGSINIPYDTIDANTNLDKNKTILVYCKSGARSNKAYNTLKKLGYDVYDMGAFDNINLEKE